MRVSRIVVVLYVIVGVIVAAQEDYFENLDTVKRVISMILAVVLWPLVLAGVDLRLR
jgi:Mn2+/Fe2+ NRAMP family transporter